MDKREKHILLFRFSAIGDIAIAAPLVRSYAMANPDIRFTMVSMPMMKELFTGIENLFFFPADFKGKYKGLKGLFKLYRELLKLNPSHIADLHNVLRTWVLRGLFSFNLIKISFLHKGRKQKRKLTRKNNKELRPLPSMMHRYESVFVKAGLENLHFSGTSDEYPGYIRKELTTKMKGDSVNIGIAPFAKHKEKAWPIEFMEEVVAALCQNSGYNILLFGGGKREISFLQSWEQKYPGVKSMAGKVTLARELEIMKNLDLMISMDSANMHLASFAGITVLSVWGATHPYAGFYGWGQREENAIQTDLSCRPCSVYGNKMCYRGDNACMMDIKSGVVLDKIYDIINKKRDV